MKNELKPIAVETLSNNFAMAIYDINYTDGTVLASYLIADTPRLEPLEYEIHYAYDGRPYFFTAYRRHYLDEFMRV